MSLTASAMLPLGTPAPAFSLPDTVSGQTCSLEQLRGERGTLIMFICNHCPYVLHVNDELVALGSYLKAQGIGVVAISANDAETYPEDGPVRMKQHAQAQGYPFVYLYDQSQSVAKSYVATCTPDFFLFDAELQLVYRGRLDASTPGNGKPTDGADLRAAAADLLAGRDVRSEQLPSMGCNIKWRPEKL